MFYNGGFLRLGGEVEYRQIKQQNIDSALAKARQYRSLLESDLAISICLDIFKVDEGHQPTIITYILALTDSLTHPSAAHHKPDKEIIDAIRRLKSAYDKVYYQGIFSERKGRALMRNAMSRSFAYNLFLQAIEYYQRAEKLSNDDNDDAVLRYNACVRTIEGANLMPRQDADDVDWQAES